MLFNSLHFLIFFPVVTALYFGAPHRWRWAVLLLASNYFYAALLPRYLPVLWAIILLDFFAGLQIEKRKGKGRAAFLVASIVGNLSALFVFKYFDFFTGNLAAFASAIGIPVNMPVLHLILPLGLSFHTFQSIAYTIEVYRGRVPAERNLGIFALYVMFYPQLVAGPIERPHHLLPQFRERHQFDWARMLDGLTLMLWGLFKKIVVADRLSLIVEPIYRDPGSHGGVALAIATYAFAIQIYCDFSGYTDIARGAARVMGFSLVENFQRPYLALTIRDFWRRWHISLSSWFRDYVYLPLGGSRRGGTRQSLGIIIVFVLSGLWHGANWTFLVWGILHGAYVLIGNATDPWRGRLRAAIGVEGSAVYAAWRCFLTFNLVAVAWVFFRAGSIDDAILVLSRIATASPASPQDVILAPSFHWVVTLAAIGGMIAVELRTMPDMLRAALLRRPTPLRWAWYYAVILAILAFGVFENPARFIYFQF
jgi:D-alanyl-lipoteichoic acid acyltransferase DltB (MBOAT superfamily)